VLILSRRAGDALMIGDDVTIVILGIKGSQVRVGIEAPKCINVYRKEICPSPRRNEKLTDCTGVVTEPS
jgi:carbon storage regulator